jgi:hypothetical protein
MSGTAFLFVALYDNPGILHWSLCIETENDADKATIQILGARQRYFPDIKIPSNARLLPDLIELMPLCDVDATKIEALKNIAYATPIRNDEADYSCQDYVLDVLGKLEEHGIIEPANKEYKRNKMAVVAKQQSWD